MTRETSSVDQLIERFVPCARAREDVRAAVIVGSRARSEYPADEWSDLDIIVITTDPARYLTSADWLSDLGNVWITFVEPTATGGGMERRVLFEKGVDVDFSIVPEGAARQLAQVEVPLEIADIIRRGTQVLLDKDGLLNQLASVSVKTVTRSPPTQQEFLEKINDFLYHAVWTAKHMRRGELWWAKSCCDSYMKRLLLRMIEWHAHATMGWDYDTWHGGRFLEQWADQRVITALRSSFAHYDTVRYNGRIQMAGD